MFLSMMEYDRQHEGPAMLLHRHPLVCEHHARTAIHLDNVMVIVYKLFRLLTRTDRHRLIWIDLIERFGHVCFYFTSK